VSRERVLFVSPHYKKKSEASRVFRKRSVFACKRSFLGGVLARLTNMI